MTAGLVVVKSNPGNPEWDLNTFEKWYSTVHIKDVCESGLADLAIRYRNLDPNARFQYLAIYRLPDVSKLQDKAVMDSVPKTSELVPGKEKGTMGGDWREALDMDMTTFECVQKFEGPNATGKRAKGLVLVGIEPAEGDDEELDKFYRLQACD